MSLLILSPHRDDAAFSCGLFLMKLVSAGVSTYIANVCTISAYAPYAHLAAAEDKVAEITDLRAEEDAAFVEHMQSEFARGRRCVQLLDLGWKDAPLRRAIATEDVLAGNPVPAEEINQLVAVFRSLARVSVVLVPLALGGHLDHRLVREAAVKTWPEDELVFYEDLPYACRMLPEQHTEQTRRALSTACKSAKTPPARSGDKRRVALFYCSQIAEAVADEMEDYGASLGWRERLYGTETALRSLANLSGGQWINEDRLV